MSELSREVSQDMPLSLQEIEPSPVEETPAEYSNNESYFPEKQDDDDNTPPPPQLYNRATTTTLGLGNHGPAYYLLKLQRYSTYAFTIFATFHITNTSLIPLLTQSIPASETYLLLTRPYYQSIPFEPLLITAPLSLHIASGLALRLYRRRQSIHRYGAESRSERRAIKWPVMSAASVLGWCLVPLLGGHVFVNRILPLWVEGGSANVGLEYVAHGFWKHSVVANLGYTALVGVGSWHVTWGWAKWLGLAPSTTTGGMYEGKAIKKRKTRVVNLVAAVVAAIWMAGGLGVVGRGGEAVGWLGKEYDELYRKIPIFGHWF